VSEPRTALVTGATSGIGRAACAELSDLGYRVFATGRRHDALSELETRGHAAGTFAGDATDARFPKEVFAAADTVGNPSIVVISAGIGLPGTLMESDQTKWADLLDINLLAPMRLMRLAAERFVREAERDGEAARDIVVIGSTVGRNVSAANPVYGATKFALHSLAESLRREVCSSGIRVSLIEPGFVRTGFQSAAEYDMAWFNAQEEVSGPFLRAEDVARAIVFIVGQPPHVHIDDVRIRPTRQAT
jgi:NADP-dependent 3-hydroxy acid dehydrogenase YdfG